MQKNRGGSLFDIVHHIVFIVRMISRTSFFSLDHFLFLSIFLNLSFSFSLTFSLSLPLFQSLPFYTSPVFVSTPFPFYWSISLSPRHPVYSMSMTGSGSALELLTASTDGTLCQWDLSRLNEPTNISTLSTPSGDQVSTSSF